jgi:hypothetical protein
MTPAHPVAAVTITHDPSCGGRVLLSVHGAFDSAAGRQLGHLLSSAPPGSHAVVDLSRAPAFPDFAVASLAQILGNAPGTVSLVGLGAHQRRILEYLGVEDRATPGAGRSAT